MQFSNFSSEIIVAHSQFEFAALRWLSCCLVGGDHHHTAPHCSRVAKVPLDLAVCEPEQTKPTTKKQSVSIPTHLGYLPRATEENNRFTNNEIATCKKCAGGGDDDDETKVVVRAQCPLSPRSRVGDDQPFRSFLSTMQQQQ